MTPLRVTNIERSYVRLPFHDRYRPGIDVDVPTLAVFEIITVRTNSGVVGYGESPWRYTPRRVTDAAIAMVVGDNPVRHLFDDALGTGLQMALFDAVGKVLGVPMYSLLGAPLVRDAVGLAWWCSQTMSPTQLATDARQALAAGYAAIKIKGRPWWDVFAQVEAITDAAGPAFLIDIDWNGTLFVRGEAAEVLAELDRRPGVAIYEAPLRMHDLDGMQALRTSARRPVVDHFRPGVGRPALARDALDGFVLHDGGVRGLIEQAHACEAFDKPYWLQVLGAGMTTAFVTQLAAVLPGCRWPSVTCQNLYADDVATPALQVCAGRVAVPDAPGLGVTVDEDAVARLAWDPAIPVAAPRHVAIATGGSGIEVRRPTLAGLKAYIQDAAPLPARSADARLDIDVDYRTESESAAQ